MSSFTRHRLWTILKSPWAIGCYIFGAGTGAYYIIKGSQMGMRYEMNADLNGKTYIVTGATSGIGEQVARELAKRNARVIMACRDRKKCVEVRRDVVIKTNNRQVYCRHCDLTDFDSIRSFVSKISEGKFKVDRIDGVLLNAGTMESKRNVNKEGIEIDLVTNCVGPFLLTGLLLDNLLAQKNPVRMVFTNTNTVCRNCEINFEDMNFEKREAWAAYPNYKETKLAQALFAKELSERIEGTNLNVFMVDPGQTRTNLTAKLDAEKFFLSRWILKPVGFFMGQQRAETAAYPVLYALVDDSLNGKNGIFLNRERQVVPWCDSILNEASRKRLWLTCIKWSQISKHLEAIKNEVDKEKDADSKLEETFSNKPTRWFWFF